MLELSGGGARELRRSCSPRLTLLQVDITQPQQVQQALLDTKAKLGLSGTPARVCAGRALGRWFLSVCVCVCVCQVSGLWSTTPACV